MSNFNNFAVLHFTEMNPPAQYDQLKLDVLIQTDMDKDEVKSLAVAIGNIKMHADDGESLSGFEISEIWDELGWDEKIQEVVEYMQDYVGRFVVVNVFVADTEVN